MDPSAAARGLRVGVRWLLWPLDQLGPFWGMTLVSILSGAVLLWLIGKTTPQRLLERAKDRMASGVYEVRLYLDSPGRMLRAQGRLLGWGLAYVALMLPSFLVASVILGPLFVHYESRYALAPLAPGATTIVRVATSDGGSLSVPPGAGFTVTAPPVWDETEGAVYLRVRVDEPGRHALVLRSAAGQISVPLQAAPADFIPADRARGLDVLFAYGDEPPLPRGPISSVHTTYPAAAQRWLTLDMPWWIYWLGLATLAAFALRRPLGVIL